MNKRYVIIGGNASGTSAAVRLRRLDDNAQITMYERESSALFACCGMPYYLGGIAEKNALIPETADTFQQKYNIEVRTDAEVVDINRQYKTIIIRDMLTEQMNIYPYDKLILATGTTCVFPSVSEIQSGFFMIKTLADMMSISNYIDANHVRRAAIIGGGTIGMLTAENLSRRGIKTCVIELNSHVLPCFDDDIAQYASSEMENNGVAIITNITAKKAEKTVEGLCLDLIDGRSVCVDIVIACAVIRPEVSLAKKADLGIGVTGGIIVDERQQTTDKDIYAVGNAVEVECVYGGKEIASMASTAVKQGRVAADNICGINSKYKHTINVSVIRLFDIDLACAGLTESQLKKRDIRYEKVYNRVNTHELYYPKSDAMTIKMLFDKKTGRIYGVQIAGRSGVDKRIDVFATAMQAGLSVDRIAALELGYTPPFAMAQDAVNRTCCIAENVMNGLSDVVHWHDIQHQDCVLLDVRSDEERRVGEIPGSLHIPFSGLRNRLNDLPNGRGIVVYSQYGRRGYMAERMLKQHGLNARNLSGGYDLYRIFTRNN